MEQPSENARWNAETDKNLEITLGEFASFLPVLEADSYQSFNEALDSGDVTYTRIICYCEEAEDKAAVYRVGLKFAGWDVGLDDMGRHYEGYVRVSFDSLLLVTFASGTQNGKQAVTIAAWIYHDKVKEFPNDKVKEFSSHELPILKADCYTFATGSMYGIDVLELCCYGVNENTYLEYIDTLMDDGWDMQVYYNSYSGYKASWGYYNQLTYYDVETAQASGFETDRSLVTIDIYRS
ncbi:MAG: hypothetical protein J6328_00070 [Bacilli bacterium]|nr:hypothetical protein [Bacilli bacterium]